MNIPARGGSVPGSWTPYALPLPGPFDRRTCIFFIDLMALKPRSATVGPFGDRLFEGKVAICE